MGREFGSSATSVWRTGGSRSSTFAPKPASRCAMRTEPYGLLSTAKFITSRSCGKIWKPGAINSKRPATRKRSFAYEEYGRDCLSRLRGMFAFAIWDSRTRTLFLARDRVGKKPLYYYADRERFLFASEERRVGKERRSRWSPYH